MCCKRSRGKTLFFLNPSVDVQTAHGCDGGFWRFRRRSFRICQYRPHLALRTTSPEQAILMFSASRARCYLVVARLAFEDTVAHATKHEYAGSFRSMLSWGTGACGDLPAVGL